MIYNHENPSYSEKFNTYCIIIHIINNNFETKELSKNHTELSKKTVNIFFNNVLHNYVRILNKYFVKT